MHKLRAAIRDDQASDFLQLLELFFEDWFSLTIDQQRYICRMTSWHSVELLFRFRFSLDLQHAGDSFGGRKFDLLTRLAKADRSKAGKLFALHYLLCVLAPSLGLDSPRARVPLPVSSKTGAARA